MPSLETLLRRGNKHTPCESLTESLCQVLGIRRQQDWPIAPLTANVAHLDVADNYWLRLDPVHLDVGMHGLFLRGGLSLNAEEISQIQSLAAAILSPAGLTPVQGSDGTLYVRCNRPAQLSTTPLDQVEGRQPMRFLPTGDDANTWTRLLNEVQMALHEHPLNLSRQARGLLPVNSLWPWGGGQFAQADPRLKIIWAHTPLARQLAAALDIPCHPTPQEIQPCLAATGREGLILLNADPERPANTLLQHWENQWFKPLLGALRLGRLASAKLIVLGPQPAFASLTPMRTWRFWA